MTPRYFPYSDGRWRLHIGLAALDPGEWLELDDDAPKYLQTKRDLLATRRSQVLVALEGSESAQQEVLTMLRAHLSEHSHLHQVTESGVVDPTGRFIQSADFQQAPIEMAALLVQEDLCVLAPVGDEFVLVAACVCFPSRWSLIEKLGRSLVAIHAPVPGYDRQLAGPVDRLFARLHPEAPLQRTNWTIVDSPQLFLPPDAPRAVEAITAENAGERLWIRVERQTLRRLPATGAILFTIRTYIDPLRVLEAEPAMARALATAIRQIPEQMQLYKSVLSVREALLGYLEAQAN